MWIDLFLTLLTIGVIWIGWDILKQIKKHAKRNKHQS